MEGVLRETGRPNNAIGLEKGSPAIPLDAGLARPESADGSSQGNRSMIPLY